MSQEVYAINDDEAEGASNGYLMSMVSVILGMPLPILNLLASIGYFLGVRKSSHFIRWHAFQSMISQLTIFLVNTTTVSWTLTIVFGAKEISNSYIGWVAAALIFNLLEIIASIHAAIVVRKRKHVSWWGFGEVTDAVFGEVKR